MDRDGEGVLVLANALADAVEAVRHDATHDGEVGGGPEAARGQIALVLDGLVAADGRHVLRHCCGADSTCGKAVAVRAFRAASLPRIAMDGVMARRSVVG